MPDHALYVSIFRKWAISNQRRLLSSKTLKKLTETYIDISGDMVSCHHADVLEIRYVLYPRLYKDRCTRCKYAYIADNYIVINIPMRDGSSIVREYVRNGDRYILTANDAAYVSRSSSWSVPHYG